MGIFTRPDSPWWSGSLGEESLVMDRAWPWALRQGGQYGCWRGHSDDVVAHIAALRMSRAVTGATEPDYVELLGIVLVVRPRFHCSTHSAWPLREDPTLQSVPDANTRVDFGPICLHVLGVLRVLASAAIRIREIAAHTIEKRLPVLGSPFTMLSAGAVETGVIGLGQPTRRSDQRTATDRAWSIANHV